MMLDRTGGETEGAAPWLKEDSDHGLGPAIRFRDSFCYDYSKTNHDIAWSVISDEIPPSSRGLADIPADPHPSGDTVVSGSKRKRHWLG